jgi:hypothetical protein
MSMLTEQQQRVIEDGLSGLVHPVSVLYYAPDVASAATRVDQALLEAIAHRSDRVRLEVLADRWDGPREEGVGIARTPAIVVKGEQDYGIRYYGTPDGYELETFLGVVRAVSARRSGLSDASRAEIAGLAERLHLEVLVAPT